MKRFTTFQLLSYSIVLSLLSVLATVLFMFSLGFPTFDKNQMSEDTEQLLENNTSSVTQFTTTAYYDITEEERYLLAKLAHSEGSICSEECQRDIVSVVFNRLESGKWKRDMDGDGVITLYDIIYYPSAFTPATNGAIDKYEPTAKDYAAVDYVLTNGPTLPKYVRYFRASHDFSWAGYLNYKTIDNVYFGYFEDWEKGVW